MQLRQFIQRNKRLIIPIIFFIWLLIFYFLNRHFLTVYWQGVVEGQKINARHIIETIIWLTIASILCSAIDVFVWEGIVYKRTGNLVPQLLKTTVNIIIFLIITIVIVALVYNRSITGLLATTGALTLVIGFALKGILENAFQGIALNIAQIFKTGDIISIPGKFDELAIVKDITMRNTYLEDFAGHIIAIPNSVVCTNVIKNFSRSKDQIFSVGFSVFIGIRGLSILTALSMLKSLIATTDFVVQDPPPQVLIGDVQNVQVKFDINFWAKRFKITPYLARHILYTKIIEQLSIAGYSFGVPIPDFDGLEKRLALLFHKYNLFIQMSPEEKNHFYEKETKNKSTFNILKSVDLFKEFTPSEIEELSESIHPKYFKAGETIIRQDESNDQMYVLAEGALEIFIQAQGKEDVLSVAKLNPGKYFGEMALLVGETRTATVTAITDSLVYEITKQTMSQLFENHPEMITKISEKIADQQLLNLMKQEEYSAKEALTKRQSFTSILIKRISSFFSSKNTSQ